ncbi:hypothetical protein E3N88_23125 [Mikania micrantha]|uniref:DUF4371 domain-containing protein n=1 Tax=Mikania micrantha TaxID=192012 RepID=A0A5N6NCM4_9ASTR|nr:hypothetical protein E3N88_23125 [Mikania micrantha]
MRLGRMALAQSNGLQRMRVAQSADGWSSEDELRMIAWSKNLGFLNVNDTTGKCLFEVTLKELKSFGLEINDMRGQGYDNGANMKGKHQGVQKRFLDLNPRAFYTPYGCHSLNLTLCDMANTCVKGKSFFGVLQRINTNFGNSINRWKILKGNVKGWSFKALSQTCWESRVESVKAIKLQLCDVREALLDVGEKDNDAAIASEANSLAEKELSDFEPLLDSNWCHINLDRGQMLFDVMTRFEIETA